jgi:hypothetical protein
VKRIVYLRAEIYAGTLDVENELEIEFLSYIALGYVVTVPDAHLYPEEFNILLDNYSYDETDYVVVEKDGVTYVHANFNKIPMYAESANVIAKAEPGKLVFDSSNQKEIIEELKTLNKFAIIHGSKDAVSSILEEYGFTYNYDIKYTPNTSTFSDLVNIIDPIFTPYVIFNRHRKPIKKKNKAYKQNSKKKQIEDEADFNDIIL